MAPEIGGSFPSISLDELDPEGLLLLRFGWSDRWVWFANANEEKTDLEGMLPCDVRWNRIIYESPHSRNDINFFRVYPQHP